MSKWLTWKPQMFVPSLESEPPKPTKPPGEGLEKPGQEVSEGVMGGEHEREMFVPSLESEPPKPTKPPGEGPKEGSVGFGGSISKEHQKIEGARASLKRAGVRFLTIGGERVAGVWSDRDGERVREALREFGAGALSVRYLDGPGVPERWKGRTVPGDPVPVDVLAAMMAETCEPWRVRDEKLTAMRWSPEGSRGRAGALWVLRGRSP